MHVISYYTHLEEMSAWLYMCGMLAVCLRCQWICEVCSRVCIQEKKGRKGSGGSKWLGSVSVTVNLLNHLPPSNKIEHQAELNNCQTPRHHPNREEISGKNKKKKKKGWRGGDVFQGRVSRNISMLHLTTEAAPPLSVKESSKSPCQVNQV